MISGENVNCETGSGGGRAKGHESSYECVYLEDSWLEHPRKSVF